MTDNSPPIDKGLCLKLIGFSPQVNPVAYTFLYDVLACPLRENWGTRLDKKNRVYFVNFDTRKTCWEHPLSRGLQDLALFMKSWNLEADVTKQVELEVARVKDVYSVELGEWTRSSLVDGRAYFVHKLSLVTRWSDPQVELQALLELKLFGLELLLSPDYMSKLRLVRPAEYTEPPDDPLGQTFSSFAIGPPVMGDEDGREARSVLESIPEAVVVRTANAGTDPPAPVRTANQYVMTQDPTTKSVGSETVAPILVSTGTQWGREDEQDQEEVQDVVRTELCKFSNNLSQFLDSIKAGVVVPGGGGDEPSHVVREDEWVPTAIPMHEQSILFQYNTEDEKAGSVIYPRPKRRQVSPHSITTAAPSSRRAIAGLSVYGRKPAGPKLPPTKNYLKLREVDLRAKTVVKGKVGASAVAFSA